MWEVEMFCPKCGVKNMDDAKFCRACGANISLVSQALEGRLADAKAPDWYRLGVGSPPSIEKGVREIFMGIGFLLIALAILIFAPGGSMWWFWMLIPTFALVGGGVGQIVRLRRDQALRPRSDAGASARPTIDEQCSSPSSVTERTTKLLEKQADTLTARLVEEGAERKK